MDNVANLVFAEEEGSFLIGAAAALKTKTDHIGFIGGVEVPLIQKFEAGYIAGAKEVKPDIKIDASSLQQFDTAAIAVLLECQRMAHAWG